MKIPVVLLHVFLTMTLAEAAFAVEGCDQAVNNADLGRELKALVMGRTPVKYFDVARSIELVTQPFNQESFVPFATEFQGRKIVVVPPEFALVVCKLALAEYLQIRNSQKTLFDRAALKAANCLDGGGSIRTCFIGFSNDLASQYQRSFASMSATEQRFALSMYDAALMQIVMHEYGHHFLNHLARDKTQEKPRVDEEFEADLFAVLNGMESGEPAWAMVYVFGPLADIERRTTKLATKDYESSSCRASNVENIAAVTGIAPTVLVDAAFGGGSILRKDSPALFRSVGEKQFAGEAPGLKPGSCGRIAKVALGATFEELKRLYSRMETDVDLLFAAADGMDAPRTIRLLNDLSAMAGKFQYMETTAAKCISLIVRKWELGGRKVTPLLGSPDRLLNAPAVSGNFMSDDFGRMLQLQGLAVLQEGTGLALQTRLDQSYSILQRAVFYNPGQSEAWENLAFIAFERGDCVTAADFAEKSVATFTNKKKDQLEHARFLAGAMKKMSSDPKTCASEGAKFHPYPGL
jgi:hypothetical protein